MFCPGFQGIYLWIRRFSLKKNQPQNLSLFHGFGFFKGVLQRLLNEGAAIVI